MCIYVYVVAIVERDTTQECSILSKILLKFATCVKNSFLVSYSRPCRAIALNFGYVLNNNNPGLYRFSEVTLKIFVFL